MQIEELTITQKELNEAVQQWLAKRGLNLNVEEVSKNYTRGGFKVEIEIKEPTPILPPPEIKSVEELCTAIEKGEV